MDHQINAAHKLTGSLFLARATVADPFASSTQIPNYAIGGTDNDQRNIVVNEDWIINPGLLNQIRFAYSLNSNNQATQVHTSWSDWQQSDARCAAAAPAADLRQRVLADGTFGDDKPIILNIGHTLTLMRSGHSIQVVRLGEAPVVERTVTGLRRSNRFRARRRRMPCRFSVWPRQYVPGNKRTECDFSPATSSVSLDNWKSTRKVTLNLAVCRFAECRSVSFWSVVSGQSFS